MEEKIQREFVRASSGGSDSVYEIEHSTSIVTLSFVNAKEGDKAKTHIKVNLKGITSQKALAFVQKFAKENGKEREFAEAMSKKKQQGKKGLKFIFGFLSLCVGSSYENGYYIKKLRIPNFVQKVEENFFKSLLGIMTSDPMILEKSYEIKASYWTPSFKAKLCFQKITVKYQGQVYTVYGEPTVVKESQSQGINPIFDHDFKADQTKWTINGSAKK